MYRQDDITEILYNSFKNSTNHNEQKFCKWCKNGNGYIVGTKYGMAIMPKEVGETVPLYIYNFLDKYCKNNNITWLGYKLAYLECDTRRNLNSDIYNKRRYCVYVYNDKNDYRRVNPLYLFKVGVFETLRELRTSKAYLHNLFYDKYRYYLVIDIINNKKTIQELIKAEKHKKHLHL